MHEPLIHELVASLVTRMSLRRFLLGIAGPPGSGKSTFAEKLQAARGFATCIPLDGFHLSNATLDRLHLRPVKGSPQTYDVPAFLALLGKLRDESQSHFAPKYSRELHEPVAGAIAIGPEIKLIIVEGNYLLLDTPPWNKVRGLLDETWYLDVPEDVCMARVHARHVQGGCSETQAAYKIETNDRPNYRLIAATKSRADRVIDSTD